MNDGKAPVMEPGLTSMFEDLQSRGQLRATGDPTEAVSSTDISLVCVGTPSDADGGISTEALLRASGEIGQALRDDSSVHTIAYRSTMLPGTCESKLVPEIERASGRKVGSTLRVCVNPEFLREGTGVADFANPTKTVVGETTPGSGEALVELYSDLPGDFFVLPVRVAELAKYVDNAFHALKVGFANEVGALCHAHGIDSHRLMETFVTDTRLNIGAAYLRPGFAFGGSCLPKDLRALLHRAEELHVSLPILGSIIRSNELHISRAVDLITRLEGRRVGLLGLAFKAGTDDLRESPYVELAQRLIGKGCELSIYDPEVQLSKLVGANRTHLEHQLPHIANLLKESPDEVVKNSDICVVAATDPIILNALTDRKEITIVDLVRIPTTTEVQEGSSYHCIAW